MKKTGTDVVPANAESLAFLYNNPRLSPLISPLVCGKRVTIIGLGGGAEISLHLLRSGVICQNLIDFDTLEEGNLVRHTCGREYVGKNKAQATKEYLCKYLGCDEAELPMITAHDMDIFANTDKFRELVAESDVVIIGTDTDSSRYFANDVCVELKVPAVFVSMFEKGAGGEVFCSIPGRACYGCITGSERRQVFLEEYTKTLDKKDCSSDRDVKASPGLGIDQSFLCSIAARKALDIILADTESLLPSIGTDLIIWSLSGLGGSLTAHLSSRCLTPNRKSDCYACGEIS